MKKFITLCALICTTNFLQAVMPTVIEPTPVPTGKEPIVTKAVPAKAVVAVPAKAVVAVPAKAVVATPAKAVVATPAKVISTPAKVAPKPFTPAPAAQPKPFTPAVKPTSTPAATPAKTSTPTTQTTIAPTKTTPIQINIKNTSNYQGTLTGFKILHKESGVSQESASSGLNYTIKTAAASKNAKDEKSLSVAFDLKTTAAAFIAGPSEISINNQPITLQPSLINTIYVTSADGKTWQLDGNAIKTNEQNISKPTLPTPAISNISKVTETTKAAAVPLMEPSTVLHKIQAPAVPSKASQATQKALSATVKVG